jgi:histidyl-tRNA synthetase
MIPDAEIISLLGTVLTKLEVGEFTIKVGVLVGFQDRQALTQMLLSAES